MTYDTDCVEDFVHVDGTRITIGDESHEGGKVPLLDAEELGDFMHNLLADRYQVNIVSPVVLCGSADGLFSAFGTDENLLELDNSLVEFDFIDGIENLDTSRVTSMSGMFEGYLGTSLDLRNFNTSNVFDMSEMFENCSNLRNLDLSSFDTSNVDNMHGMFYGSCLRSVDVSSFDTSNVVDMSEMFGNCEIEDSLDLSSFDTSNVSDMSSMFRNSVFGSLDLSSFSFDSLRDSWGMFDCRFDKLGIKDMVFEAKHDDDDTCDIYNVPLKAKNDTFSYVTVNCSRELASDFAVGVVKVDSDSFRPVDKNSYFDDELCTVSWDTFGKYSAGSCDMQFDSFVNKYAMTLSDPGYEAFLKRGSFARDTSLIASDSYSTHGDLTVQDILDGLDDV